MQAPCRAFHVALLTSLRISDLTSLPSMHARSLDYRISGYHVPPGSWDAQVLDELRPGPDEIVLPKSSSSVFNSTNVDYILK